MTHKYSIKGMSCSGCVNNVQKALEAVPGVTKVNVQQQPGEAEISMEKHIDTAVLQEAVKQYGNYQLSELH